MPIEKGSRAARERALKAAETRRRNADNRSRGAFVATYPELESDMSHVRAAPITRKLRNPMATPRKPRKPPAFPASYHATPTRHVTRDLRLKQTPVRVRHPYKLPASRAAVRKLDNIELQRQYNYWQHVKGADMPKRKNADIVVDELKQEMRRRAESTYGDLPRIKAHRARRGVRKERGRK